MKLFSKFYMADPPNGGGSGPSDRDIRNAEELNRQYSEMQRTLRGIGPELLNEINEQMEFLDETVQDIVKSIGKDLNREIQSSIKHLS